MSGQEIRLSLDRSRCVLCGEPNDCVMAGGGDDRAAADEPCWCVGRDFPESLTARATERDGAASCICRACLESHSKQGC